MRCAVYTRKSTEDGLEQDFNSLDAQREACTAYVASQRHEGWEAVPDLYDDGGFSGRTMERPALKQLLAEIETGRIDIIVVYKVDRLIRGCGKVQRTAQRLHTPVAQTPGRVDRVADHADEFAPSIPGSPDLSGTTFPPIVDIGWRGRAAASSGGR